MKGIRVLPWLFMLLLTACGTRNDAVRRTSEGGVEVVQNHIKPYRVKGVPSSLRLEEELAIDTEREDLVKRGVADIWGFDVNSLGDIFIFQPPMSTDRLISKFDKLGRFVTSFALKGQGPGEVQWPIFHKISSGDGVPVLDMVSRKLLLFNKDGIFLRETEVPFEIRGSAMLLQLPNGNYLHRKAEVTPSQENPSMVLIYRLINRDFQDIRELDRVQIPNPFGVPMVNLPLPLTAWAVAQDRIYMGNSEKGYELSVYDLDGNLIRKIRKEFASVPFPEEKKLAVLKTLESPSLAPLRDKLAFPTASPSFQHLFCDDEGRLYVMTYEKGEKAGEFLFDVFNADSVFIAMTSCAAHLSADLYAPGSPTDSWVTAKNGRLYAVREKANGYKELVVYRMIWK